MFGCAVLSIYHLHVSVLIGVYPIRPQVPAVGGSEGVGEVHAVGSAVTSLSVGDRVIPCPTTFGIIIISHYLKASLISERLNSLLCIAVLRD